ncbi:MAG TPA: hypothetical protein DCR43_07100 [Bacteroidales bacterium]|nr:MAG: hypothetical protein A2X11_16570 [Bacteroidetes bacterium GWE2_42_24]OFY26341.1 MAG: hypothetical protein A2X09_00125 [Bacteroidetes bacterium GWF2_43_11]HAQ65600.1 hypothetical protein [Bacteroidales bacterium]HBZ66906.1 hypothetical protein [Bacteroidales bacterium]
MHWKLTLCLLFFAFFWVTGLKAQTTDDLLKLLTGKGVLTAEEADSLRAEAAIARQNGLPQNHFTLSMEYRPRTELRYGYQQLPADTSVAAFLVGQRTRLSLAYDYSNRLSLAFSMQDLRIWGSQNPKSMSGTVQVFEAWVEPRITPEWSVRVGRQKLSYDNQRLFAENNWRIGGNVHDAALLKYQGAKLVVHLAGAFNQSADNAFGTDFAPSGFTNYKSLVMNYIKYSVNDRLSLTAINVADGWQDETNVEKIHQRFTSGGRIEYLKGSFQAGAGAWYQYGHNTKGVDLAAWYVNPEVRYTLGDWQCRAGAELFSGNKPGETDTDKSFSPLYGSGHNFNGSLDLITKFPGDVGGAGLVNPYLNITWKVSKTFSVRTDVHGFWLQNDYVKNKVTYDRWIGVENDWLVNYKPNSYTGLDLGISYASVSETFEVIKEAQSGAHNRMPYFVYFALTIKPALLNSKW